MIRFNLDRRYRRVELWYDLLDEVEPFRGIRIRHLKVVLTTTTGWPQVVEATGHRILKSGEDGAAASKIIWAEADAPAWALEIIEQARRDFD